MSASGDTKNLILDSMLGDGHSGDWPSTLYVGLFTGTPTDLDGGTEVSGNNYARVAIDNDSDMWPDAVSGQKANGETIAFPVPSGGWGIIEGFGLFTASSGGDLLLYGSLSSPTNVFFNSEPQFAPGTLTIEVD